MSVIAIIPARGGSKGIPRKNLIPICGKPMLVYTIEHALAAASVDRVIVSTDDDEIARVASAHGAHVIRRPVEISGDEASSETALVHVLDTLEESEDVIPELVVFLQATSPLRATDDVENAIDTLRRTAADSLFSACPAHGFVWRQQPQGWHSLNYDYRKRPRRQDAPTDVVENGSIYVFKPDVLRAHGNRLGGKIAAYLMPSRLSFEVDEPEDLILMESLVVDQAGGRRADRAD